MAKTATKSKAQAPARGKRSKKPLESVLSVPVSTTLKQKVKRRSKALQQTQAETVRQILADALR